VTVGAISYSVTAIAQSKAQEGIIMKIGIIGTGNIGGVLARKLRAAGHDVRVANSRGVEGVRDFAQAIGATPVDVRGAVAGVDAVILSIPFPAVAALPKDLFDGLPQDLPIIDTGNYYPDLRDPHIAELDAGLVESVWVSRQIGRPIIKAFNNILAYSLAELGRPEGAQDRLAIAVAGDDPRAKAIASTLVNTVGCAPGDAGGLAESWRQQPSTPAYCCDWNAEETRSALAAATPGAARPKRDAMMETYGKLRANPTHADIVAANRATNAN
jgi:predicted dinucleotide-binding enzyme